jgi:mannose/fructose/N-acetylgalactosamine-specific phosphotransferase system component IIC
MITLQQALLVALLYWICQNAWLTNAAYRLYFPLGIGLFVGIIMGDPVKGTMLGGILQTMNMAPSMVGSTVTMDLQMAAFITIPMAIATNMDTEVIVAFAVPFTVIGAFLQPLCRSLNQIGIELADKAAAKGDTRTFYFVSIFLQSIIQFPVYFGIMFVSLYWGQTAMSSIIAAIPEWLMIAFIALAKFLPGIGFAMFLKSSGRKEKYPFFFLGFYIMYFFSEQITLIGITIIAAILAVLIVNNKNTDNVQAV